MPLPGGRVGVDGDCDVGFGGTYYVRGIRDGAFGVLVESVGGVVGGGVGLSGAGAVADVIVGVGPVLQPDGIACVVGAAAKISDCIHEFAPCVVVIQIEHVADGLECGT